MPTLTAYDELLLKLKPRPIRTEADYQRTLKQVDELMAEPSPEAGVMVDLLASLIESYEAENFPIELKLSPARLLAELIEARGITVADIARAMKVSPSLLSNVLAGRRDVSKEMALKLAAYFRLPVSHFLKQTRSRAGASAKLSSKPPKGRAARNVGGEKGQS